MPGPLIFLSAGEASGDHYGAALIEQLRRRLPEAKFMGLGGTAMQQAGQRRIVRAEDVAFMGITEILRHVPRILFSYARLVRSIRRERPQIAILIDFPDVNFRLAKHCKQLGIPVVWFVSPQLWAWKRKRLRWVQQRVTRMLTIFPFEEPFYRARGVAAQFVGHPLAAAPPPTVSRQEYAAAAQHVEQKQYRWNEIPMRSHPHPYWKALVDPAMLHHTLDVDKPWIALLPGSRRHEIAANLQTLVAAAQRLGSTYEYLIPVAPGISDQDLAMYQSWVGSQLWQQREPRITFVRDARAALFHARAAAVASGTATVQAAVLGTPFVTVYRVSNATFRAAKKLVRYPEEVTAATDAFGNLPVSMPNLVAGERVSAELLQAQFTPDNVADALLPLLRDGSEREAAIAGLRRVRDRLLHPGNADPVALVSDTVVELLNVSAYARASSAPSPSASN